MGQAPSPLTCLKEKKKERGREKEHNILWKQKLDCGKKEGREKTPKKFLWRKSSHKAK